MNDSGEPVDPQESVIAAVLTFARQGDDDPAAFAQVARQSVFPRLRADDRCELMLISNMEAGAGAVSVAGQSVVRPKGKFAMAMAFFFHDRVLFVEMKGTVRNRDVVTEIPNAAITAVNDVGFRVRGQQLPGIEVVHGGGRLLLALMDPARSGMASEWNRILIGRLRGELQPRWDDEGVFVSEWVPVEPATPATQSAPLNPMVPVSAAAPLLYPQTASPYPDMAVETMARPGDMDTIVRPEVTGPVGSVQPIAGSGLATDPFDLGPATPATSTSPTMLFEATRRPVNWAGPLAVAGSTVAGALLLDAPVDNLALLRLGLALIIVVVWVTALVGVIVERVDAVRIAAAVGAATCAAGGMITAIGGFLLPVYLALVGVASVTLVVAAARVAPSRPIPVAGGRPPITAAVPGAMFGAPPTEFASFGRRFAARSLDAVLLLLSAFVCAGVAFGIGAALAPDAAGVGALIAWLLCDLGFFIYYWVGCASGQTIGNRALGYQKLRLDGTKVGSGKGFANQFLTSLSSFVFFIGWLAPLWTPRRQTWHDSMTGVVAVPGRAPKGARPAVTFLALWVLILGIGSGVSSLAFNDWASDYDSYDFEWDEGTATAGTDSSNSHDEPSDSGTASGDSGSGESDYPEGDQRLAGLQRQCGTSDMASCDALYRASQGGSALEAFAGRCGGRLPSGIARGDCVLRVGPTGTSGTSTSRATTTSLPSTVDRCDVITSTQPLRWMELPPTCLDYVATGGPLTTDDLEEGWFVVWGSAIMSEPGANDTALDLLGAARSEFGSSAGLVDSRRYRGLRDSTWAVVVPVSSEEAAADLCGRVPDSSCTPAPHPSDP